MKNRFGGLLLMVLFPCLLIAQNRIGVIDGNSTLKECREYFRRNIDQLDPIEGIYQVESFAQERNNYREFPIQKLDSYTIVVVKIREGVFHVSDYVTISRIGETMYYNYVVDWESKGWDAYVFLTSEWSNLNQENWYAVSVGIYSSKEDALQYLEEIQKSQPDAYIKYSGEYQGK